MDADDLIYIGGYDTSATFLLTGFQPSTEPGHYKSTTASRKLDSTQLGILSTGLLTYLVVRVWGQ